MIYSASLHRILKALTAFPHCFLRVTTIKQWLSNRQKLNRYSFYIQMSLCITCQISAFKPRFRTQRLCPHKKWGNPKHNYLPPAPFSSPTYSYSSWVCLDTRTPLCPGWTGDHCMIPSPFPVGRPSLPTLSISSVSRSHHKLSGTWGLLKSLQNKPYMFTSFSSFLSPGLTSDC